MRQPRLRVLPAAILLLACLTPLNSCATVLGTVASPITGGVDMARRYVWRGNWAAAPIYFVGGMIAGPFVAFYNGASYDASVFSNFSGYWSGFDQVFRPFEMVNDE